MNSVILDIYKPIYNLKGVFEVIYSNINGGKFTIIGIKKTITDVSALRKL